MILSYILGFHVERRYLLSEKTDSILCHYDDKAGWIVIHMSEDETYFSHNGKIMFFLEYSEAPTEMHQKIPQLL